MSFSCSDGFHAQSLAIESVTAESLPAQPVLVATSVPEPTTTDDKKNPIITVQETSPLDLNASNELPTISMASVDTDKPAMPVFNVRATAAEPGIQLTNKSKKDCTYYFYDNLWNGNGTAGANFDHPLKNATLKPGASAFVPLPATFKGRVQRGTQLPCTWVEFQLDASDDHGAHGDVSLQQGCDGAATIASTDGVTGLMGWVRIWSMLLLRRLSRRSGRRLMARGRLIRLWVTGMGGRIRRRLII